MRRIVLINIALAIITLAVYWQVGNHKFLYLDDDVLVTENVHIVTGINTENIFWAFSQVPGIGWFPVSWLSHMADIELYGLNPRGHHLTNVYFHITATLLLFILLYRLTGAVWKSTFVAVLFALHPLHVESVAWVAERRDVLSGFFGLITLLLYIEYARTKRSVFYLFALLTFILGLMSKAILVTLPAIMVFIDYWPLERFGRRNKSINDTGITVRLIIKEKIPFIACSLLTVAFAMNTVASKAVVEKVDLTTRIGNAISAYIIYIGKVIYPVDLAIFYPFSSFHPWQNISSLLLFLAITATVFRLRNNHPYFIVGWLWFVVFLLPVIGIVQFADYLIADRYTYLSSIGLFIGVTWGVPELIRPSPWRKTFISSLAGIVVIFMTILTWQQLSYWRDSISLFKHTLQVTSGGSKIHNNLGIAYSRSGETEKAIIEYQKAISINPNNYQFHNNLGTALARKHLYPKAIESFKKAILIKPDYTTAINNLGHAYACDGQLDEAVNHYRRAIGLDYHYINARRNLVDALIKKGFIYEAEKELEVIHDISSDILPRNTRSGY